MDLICYACSQPAAVRRAKIVDVDPGHVGKCWGVCHVCSIVVCSEHGFRNTNPVEYECVYCVAPGFMKRVGGEEGTAVAGPPDTMESFLASYAGLRLPILTAMREAISAYQRQTYWDELDLGAYRAAAEAFERATGGVRAGQGNPGGTAAEE